MDASNSCLRSSAVKMTRGKETYTTDLVIGLDPRAQFTAEDRKQEFDASMRVYNLLGDMSFDVDRINGVRDALLDRAGKLGTQDPETKRLSGLAGKTEEMRKKIVATKEGGALTGEERIREKTTGLYGSVTGYEGRPSDYQLARIDSLKRELDDVAGEFDSLVAKELPEVNAILAHKKLQAIHPLSREEWNKANDEPASAGITGGTLSMRGFSR